jgi:hypothetical protein
VKPIVYYISGHGFGHASRSIEVVNALLALQPDRPLHIRTSAPRWLFDLTVRGPFTYDVVDTDPGVVQHDSLSLDAGETIRRASAYTRDLPALAAREASALRQLDAAFVVADIPPLALEAAPRPMSLARSIVAPDAHFVCRSPAVSRPFPRSPTCRSSRDEPPTRQPTRGPGWACPRAAWHSCRSAATAWPAWTSTRSAAPADGRCS